MNMLKKAAAGVMAVVLLMGVTGCTEKLTFENANEVAEQCGLEKIDNVDRIAEDVYGNQDYNELVYYSTENSNEAQWIYDKVYNKSNTYPKAEVKGAAVMYSNVINSDGKPIKEYAFMFTFKSKKKAEEFYFRIESEYYILEHAEGKGEYDYTLYTFSSEQGIGLIGNYLEDNTVLYLCGNGYKKSDFALIDSCCRKMNIKYPETALK